MIRLNNNTGSGSVYPRYYGDSASAPVATAVDNSAYADTTLMQLFQFSSGVWNAIYNLSSIAPPVIADGEYMGFGGLTYQS
jgi:hypothetical protein